MISVKRNILVKRQQSFVPEGFRSLKSQSRKLVIYSCVFTFLYGSLLKNEASRGALGWELLVSVEGGERGND